MAEVAEPRSLFADILRRIDLAQAKTAAIDDMNGDFNVSSDSAGEVCPRSHKFAKEQAAHAAPRCRIILYCILRSRAHPCHYLQICRLTKDS